MSMFFGPASSGPAGGGLPRGEVLGSYETYEQARAVLDRLAEAEFEVRAVSIVGTDLRTVERIRNRLTYASVALRSALQGAFFGLMLGILMTLVDPSGSGLSILYTVGLGVGIWVLLGVIGHAVRKGRGFDSVQQLVPTRFDVVCAFESAPRAREILGGGAAAHVPGVPQGPAQVPPAPGGPASPPPGAAPPAAQGSVPPQAPTPSAQPPQPVAPGEPASGPLAGPASPDAPAAPGQESLTGSGSPAAGAPSGPGAPDAPTAAAAPGTTGTTGTAAAHAPQPQRTHNFPDLADGRPQYGIRLPEAEARALRERMLRDQGADAGGTTGAFTAPDYGRGGSGRRSDPLRPVDGGTAPGEDVTDGAGPASGPEEERFRRPRYGRRAARSEPGGRTETGTGTGTGTGAVSGTGSTRAGGADEPTGDQPGAGTPSGSGDRPRDGSG